MWWETGCEGIDACEELVASLKTRCVQYVLQTLEGVIEET